jgi:hypothetical protein
MEFKFIELALRIIAGIQVYFALKTYCWNLSLLNSNRELLLEFKCIEFAYKKHCLLPNYSYLASKFVGEMAAKEFEVLALDGHNFPSNALWI